MALHTRGVTATGYFGEFLPHLLTHGYKKFPDHKCRHSSSGYGRILKGRLAEGNGPTICSLHELKLCPQELSIGGMMKMRPSLFRNVSAGEILFDGFSDPLLTVGSLFAAPGRILRLSKDCIVDHFFSRWDSNGQVWMVL